MQASLKKDSTVQETKSIYSDESSYFEYSPFISNIDSSSNVKNINCNSGQSTERSHSFSSSIPRYFQFENIKKILNKPYHDSRRLNPSLYHSSTINPEVPNDKDNGMNHIYDYYNHYELDKSYRHKLGDIHSRNLKHVKHHLTEERILVNQKMVDDFWLEGNLPDETQFDISSDEEDEGYETK